MRVCAGANVFDPPCPLRAVLPGLAVSLPFGVDDVPWSFLMALASLGAIYALFRRRGDLLAQVGFTGREVALLCLGSIAGWAVNIPVWKSGDTYLMVNVGGALVPILLVALWIRQRRLPLAATLVGTTLVALAAWRIVTFHPQRGIVSTFPYFFLPVAVALAVAVVVSLRRPLAGVPVAYASGSLGALIGADLLHVAEINAHFQASSERSIISIGGAGVFDMVFLAGAAAMALHLAIAVAVADRRIVTAPAALDYPGTPLSLRDSRRVADHYRTLDHPNPLERALAGVALSNLALKEGDYTQTVRLAWLAVDDLLQTEGVRAALDTAPATLRDDVARLRERYHAARAGDAALRDAGEANMAAKHLLAALAARAGYRHHLEGVA